MSRPNQNPLFIVKPDHIIALDDHNLENLYIWLDKIPLSRPKKNLTRDFSDGVLFAEVIKYFLPKYVQLHNFTASGSTRLKENNWFHLNRKVLNLLRLEISHEVIHDLANCTPWAMEHVLCVIRNRIEDELTRLHAEKHQVDVEFKAWIRSDNEQDEPEADQVLNSRKTDLHSLDDFYMSQGLKFFPNPQDYQPQADIISYPSPRYKQFKLPVQEMVPKPELDQRIEACKDKQEMIDTLHRKIKQLEHLVHLKDIRIQDMSARMLAFQEQFPGPGDYMEEYNSPRNTTRGQFPPNAQQKHLKSPPNKRKFKISPQTTRRTVVAGGASRR